MGAEADTVLAPPCLEHLFGLFWRQLTADATAGREAMLAQFLCRETSADGQQGPVHVCLISLPISPDIETAIHRPSAAVCFVTQGNRAVADTAKVLPRNCLNLRGPYMLHRCRVMLVAICLLWSSSLLGDVSDSRFDSDDPQKAPFAVPLSEIEKRINNDPAADGILLSIKTKDRVLRLDLVAMPGKTSMAAATRVVFMTARLARGDYDEMRFSDEGKDLFVIDGTVIRDIGRQFLWGEENKGQNPIHLIRLFVDALRYPDGSRVAPAFQGSLMGDTTLAMRTIGEVFNPEWVANKNTKILGGD